jgi:hypothetical protein
MERRISSFDTDVVDPRRTPNNENAARVAAVVRRNDF